MNFDKRHHTHNGFTNPHNRTRLPSFWNMIKWRVRANTIQRNDDLSAIKIAKPDLDLIHGDAHNPQITWIGHSTVLIQHSGINILTDPIFSDRASPVSFFGGVKRVTKPGLSFERLPAIDAIVISHNHYDHLDTGSIKAIGNKPLWLVPLGLKSWFTKLGITNVGALDWWESHELDKAKITCTPAQHWSRRGFRDFNKSLWSSWAIKIGDCNFWFGGDTGYNEIDFKAIGSKLGPFDAAAIPIGAYLPASIMKTNHLSPEDAINVHKDIQSKWSFGIHWGTFILSDEDIHDPPIRLKKALYKSDLSDGVFSILGIGETKLLTYASKYAIMDRIT